MKIVVFSDIHGNLEAFKKFLKDISAIKVDFYIFCGDIFGYYYNQNEIINILKKMNNLFYVIGNHDKMFLDLLDKKVSLKKIVEKYGKSYEMSLINIDHNNIEFLRSMPENIEIVIDNKKIYVCHGTIEDNINGRLYPDNNILIPDTLKVDYIIYGHTHYRMNKQISGTKIINPGSLGQPRDGFNNSYLIIDTERDTEVFRTIDYSKNKLLNQINNFDPHNRYLKDILFRGEHV